MSTAQYRREGNARQDKLRWEEGKGEAATSNCAARSTRPLAKYQALVKHSEPITKIVPLPVQIHSTTPTEFINSGFQYRKTTQRNPPTHTHNNHHHPKRTTVTETSYTCTALFLQNLENMTRKTNKTRY